MVVFLVTAGQDTKVHLYQCCRYIRLRICVVFIGDLCDTFDDICADDPNLCMHGTCFSLPDNGLDKEIELPPDEDEPSYCHCSEGFFGRMCDDILDTCSNNPCLNEGCVCTVAANTLLM